MSGTWNWSEVVDLRFPEFLAAFFGVVAEGPITHSTCQDSGVMTLSQNGASFSGTATQTAQCETRGGQVFTPPFPPVLQIADGLITGGSLRFVFDPAGTCPAPYHGTISDVDGLAVALRGSGLCYTPGHPQNPLPLDPPGPPTKTLRWEAHRP